MIGARAGGEGGARRDHEHVSPRRLPGVREAGVREVSMLGHRPGGHVKRTNGREGAMCYFPSRFGVDPVPYPCAVGAYFFFSVSFFMPSSLCRAVCLCVPLSLSRALCSPSPSLALSRCLRLP